MTEELPDDRVVVETAVDAAEGVILSRYARGDIRDLDVDVYLDAPDDPDPAVVANEAVEAAEAAVDDLFEDS